MSTNGKELGQKVGDTVRGYAGQLASHVRATGSDLLNEVRATADKSIAQAEEIAQRCAIFADQVVADARVIALRSERMFENMIEAENAIGEMYQQFQEKVDAAIQLEQSAELPEEVKEQVRAAMSEAVKEVKPS